MARYIVQQLDVQENAIMLENINILDLKPYPKNSRKHSKAQLQQIADSIEEFGFINPILIDERNVILAGHGRYEAAKTLNLKGIPVIRVKDLTDSQKRAYVIADNKLASKSEWDYDTLKDELKILESDAFDLNLSGFESDEIDALFYEIEELNFKTDEPETKTKHETISKEGDIWECGNHRVMCSNSTSLDEIYKLIENEKIDLLFTDPPYNINIKSRVKNKYENKGIKNDNLSIKEFEEFIQAIVSNIKILNIKTYYIWCNWKFYGILQDKIEFNNCIVWDKNWVGLGGKSSYRPQHEFCLFKGQIDKHIKSESNVWHIDRDSSYVHPTQKPTELAVRALKNHSHAKNILDLFGGSGSTLIACEKLKRKAFIMELDPIFCDTIVRRWQAFTGEKARLSTGELFDDFDK